MKVTLIDYTGIGWPDPADRAANILIFSKNTRLNMTPDLIGDIEQWNNERKLEELTYMANTIPSSWEFVDYTFLIEGVTRAFTHQLVRTRTASFAQQTMRVLDVSEGPGWDYLTGPSIEHRALLEMDYEAAMAVIAKTYKELIKNGATIEDARGILPTNILTNIVMKLNMRNFVDMVRKRSSSRTQGEYRDVLAAMKEAALAVHPWLKLFIERDADRAISDLEKIINGSSIVNSDPNVKITMIKLLDQLRALV
jgi:flavin-dependent thymidylate synthase